MRPGDVLFSKTTQRVLGALFATGDEDGLTYAEILRRTSGGSGAIHRELKRFLEAGLIVQKGGPWHRVFLANRAHPLFPELHAIARKLTVKPRLDPIIARTLAKKYLWWVDVDEAIKNQDRLVAQVMNIGSFEDVRYIEEELGEEYLRRIVKTAQPGHFDEKAWTFWHYRLGLAKPDKVPALPQRRFS